MEQVHLWEQLKPEITRHMTGAIQGLKAHLAGLNTGRANPALLENVMVDVYGAKMPLTQLGTITAPEPRLLVVQVWDQSLITAIDSAIRSMVGMGFNPRVDGNILRIPIPELITQRRTELIKAVRHYAEEARRGVRAARHLGMEHLTKIEKEGGTSKDTIQHLKTEVQKLTTHYNDEVDTLVTAKENEITTL